jgi:hypothetical protein
MGQCRCRLPIGELDQIVTAGRGRVVRVRRRRRPGPRQRPHARRTAASYCRRNLQRARRPCMINWTVGPLPLATSHVTRGGKPRAAAVG